MKLYVLTRSVPYDFSFSDAEDTIVGIHSEGDKNMAMDEVISVLQSLPLNASAIPAFVKEASQNGISELGGFVLTWENDPAGHINTVQLHDSDRQMRANWFVTQVTNISLSQSDMCTISVAYDDSVYRDRVCEHIQSLLDQEELRKEFDWYGAEALIGKIVNMIGKHIERGMEEYDAIDKGIDDHEDEINRLIALCVDDIKDAEFVSVWDGGTRIATPCKANFTTGEVFDIGVSEDTADMVNNLDEEFIVVDGDEHEVKRKEDIDDEQAYHGFWYE